MPIPVRMLSAAVFAWLAASAARSASAQSYDVPLEGGGSVRVEADYRAAVDVPPTAVRSASRKAMIEVADNVGDPRLRALAPAVRSRVAAGTADSLLEVIDGTNFTGDDESVAKLPPLHRARQVGADYLLSVTLDRFDTAEKRLNRPGHDPIVNAVQTLTGSYRVTDVYTGAALKGGTCTVTRTRRISSGADIVGNPDAESLGEEFARKISGMLLAQAESIRDAEKGVRSLVLIEAYACDPLNVPIYLPRYDDDAEEILPQAKAEVGMLVEVDGMTVGTTPCRIPMLPGPHRIRLWREGFDSVAMQMVPYDGMTLRVGVRMDARQYDRVRDSIVFLQGLTADSQRLAAAAAEQGHRHETERELLPARIREIEAHARMLEQSGYRVDIRRDEKVDATALPNVEVHREIYPGRAPVIVP